MTRAAQNLDEIEAKLHDSPSRLAFIDNLRVFLTLLVIAHHAAQPYGPTGGRWLIFNPERAEILSAFFSTNAAFFMGLFFLISGYFLPSAYNRKGPKAFLKERLVRLGIPILFFALFVFPLMLYAASDQQVSLGPFLLQTYADPQQLELGHLWFLAHLLFYALGYCAWQHWQNRRNLRSAGTHPPSNRIIYIYLSSLAGITFLIRIWYPIDRWIRVLAVIPVEVAHLPQYLSLFILGIMAYRRDWLLQMPRQQGLQWLGIGLTAVLLRYLYSLGGQLLPTQIIAGGGWDWRSAVWSTWEAVICVGLCIGLLILFRDYINRSGKWLRRIAANAYTVYLIHLPIVIGIQIGAASLVIPPLAKFFLVTLLSVPLGWFISDSLRRLPLSKKILG